jgi:soluble lytic murein transglycosylase-like protein
MGLMQLMPGTAAQFAVDDPYDPEQNLRAGVAYLARMIERFETLELALAAYNAGPEAVERHRGVPPYRETRDYVERVLRLYQGRHADLDAATTPPGRKPFIVREADGRLVLTTDP